MSADSLVLEAAREIVPPPWRIDDPAAVSRQMEAVRALARSRNAILLAHNYQLPEIQETADFVGDSLGLALQAARTDADRIVFCGVHFMAESAKILNPEKKVLLPNLSAGCALADSITAESLLQWKERYPDHTVVTYINSSAEVKALSDICCTSANAVSVVRSISNRRILFTPDRNLGACTGAGQQRERVDDDRFSRSCFTREHIQPGAEIDRGFRQDSEVSDVQMMEHEVRSILTSTPTPDCRWSRRNSRLRACAVQPRESRSSRTSPGPGSRDRYRAERHRRCSCGCRCPGSDKRCRSARPSGDRERSRRRWGRSW